MKRHSLMPPSKADLSDVRATITMTAYLAEQMRSFGQSDLAKVYDLVASELIERCETAMAASPRAAENRLN
jgi:hypothetical protein